MTQRALPQNKEALLKQYNKRLKDDVKSLLDNFTGFSRIQVTTLFVLYN